MSAYDWQRVFLDWFVAELMESLRKQPHPTVNENVLGQNVTAVYTERLSPAPQAGTVSARPHEAHLMPRPGQVVPAPMNRLLPPYGDGSRNRFPLTRRPGVAFIPELPSPWFPMPPLHYQIASARSQYKGEPVWLPCWPIVQSRGFWAHPPYHIAGEDEGDKDRVLNMQTYTPQYFRSFRAAAFESKRPRMLEYLQPRQSRMLRLPYMAGVRDGRWFMRILEAPLWWVPERLLDQCVYLSGGPSSPEGWFWYPTSAMTSGQTAFARAPWRNDPEGFLWDTEHRYNANVEELHYPNSGLPHPVQDDFPRQAWDLPPNYGFLAYMLNRPHFTEEMRAHYPNPVARFDLSLSGGRQFRVLEVYEDNGDVVDTGHRVIGYSINGAFDRLRREIALYPGDDLKRVSYVAEREVSGTHRIVSRWDHVVYDPEGAYTTGTATVASGSLAFTMSFLPADDGYPMQGRLDHPYEDTIIWPFLRQHVLYEGEHGVIPAPRSERHATFAGILMDDRHATADIVRTSTGLMAMVVDDDDYVRITEREGSGQWLMTWEGGLSSILPQGYAALLDQERPNQHHYRWSLPEWPTVLGVIHVRGLPFRWWPRRAWHDERYRDGEEPPYGGQLYTNLAPVVVQMGGLPPMSEPLTPTSY